MRSRSARLPRLVALVLPLLVWYHASLEAADPALVDGEETAIREMLEGTSGAWETWDEVPTLVILGSVMEYSTDGDRTGYRATSERLSRREQSELVSDLTRALSTLTGGKLTAFAGVEVESLAEGDSARIFRRGTIVVGRFRGVRAATGTLGYGGRTTRRGTITAGAVILDSDSDRNSRWQVSLRTHELGHALGYNHVVSRQSVMNPHIGSAVTEFDRQVVELAFARPATIP